MKTKTGEIISPVFILLTIRLTGDKINLSRYFKERKNENFISRRLYNRRRQK